jgi:hypothetical protein
LSWKTPSIPFDGVPFFQLGVKLLQCHHGKDKHKTTKKKTEKEENVSAMHIVNCGADTKCLQRKDIFWDCFIFLD